jgi:hypothetical protein
MLLKDYIESAKVFAEESKDWRNLNEYAYYTTNGNSWEESCDNASGGIDISWAFHESAEQIEKEAGQHFVNEIADRLEQGIDEGWEADQLQEVLKLMK